MVKKMKEVNPKLFPLKVVVGSDHAGFVLKEEVKSWLLQLGFSVKDVGCFNISKVDFVPYANKAVQLIVEKQVDFGVLFCFSGVGMNIAANRFKGVRSVRVTPNEEKILSLARKHNDVNLLSLGSGFTTLAAAKKLLTVFLQTTFTHLTRYQRRNQLLDQNSN